MKPQRPPARPARGGIGALATRVSRRWPWVLAGLLCGSAAAVVLNAPASWLAGRLAEASGQRLLLADARGSLWQGSAVTVLAAGPGSRDASRLPGRLYWTLAPALAPLRLELQLRQDCCTTQPVPLALQPGFGRLRISLPAGHGELGQWPAAWLAGLGLPFNALRPGGMLRLAADGLALEAVQGRWRVSGRAELDVLNLSSVLAPLDSVGSYRVEISDAGDQGARLVLHTLQGPLRLQGEGQWVGPRLRFRGEASAEPGAEAALTNLLNLLGPRRGAAALLAIG